MTRTVVLAGALDTKGDEYAFARDRFAAAGLDVVLVDIGVLGEATIEAEVDRSAVARAGGGDLDALREAHDRGAALATMEAGLTAVVARLRSEGRLDGAFALGGTGGTSVTAAAFRQLPIGVPKLIVSTAASGNTEQYVRETDLVLVPSIVDIAGLNRISSTVIANGVGALIGMIEHGAVQAPARDAPERPLVAASMFGVTTPCVTRARERLEGLGYEVVVFHMTGSGGRAMESLIRQRYFAGVLDATTTELADHLVGGVFDAGPDRLTAAAESGVPQVVSVGALDMVNFGAPGTVPERFADRTFYEHNSSVTLMRTTAEEMAELGRQVGERTRDAGRTAVLLPLRGVSAIDVDGEPFRDAAADDRLFQSVRDGVRGGSVRLEELDLDVNDPAFADALVDRLHDLITRA